MVRDGAMELQARNTLLEDMTDTVADHVLEHNYDQTLSLTIAQNHAVQDLDAHERMMVRLEQDGVLDRAVEGEVAGDERVAVEEEADDAGVEHIFVMHLARSDRARRAGELVLQ